MKSERKCLMNAMKRIFSFITKWMKWLFLLSGLLVAILGIALLFVPTENFNALLVFIGMAMVLSGIFEIVSFFCRCRMRRSGLMLGIGLFAVILGLLLIFNPPLSAHAILYLLAFIFIYQGINTVFIFYKLNKKWDHTHIIESEVSQ